jgi:hypothetical protein
MGGWEVLLILIFIALLLGGCLLVVAVSRKARQ